MKHPILLFLFATLAGSAAAQTSAPFFQSRCETSPENQRQKTHCQTRDLTMPAPSAGTVLTVDARENGGITVRGWDGANVRVRAVIQGRSASLDNARTLAASIGVSTTGNTLRATAASGSDNKDWSVSYEVFVPTQTNLSLRATNGSIRLENVQGKISFETVNGGVNLAGLGGDVRGKTTNGGLTVLLTGPTWTGTGLDVSSTNGGVTCQVPATYAGIIVARTTHGRAAATLAPEVNKLLQPHNLTATFGKGGPQLRLSTVNGGVTVQQEGGKAEAAPIPVAPAAPATPTAPEEE